MTSPNIRENGLDVFRLLAAIGVISVHVGFFEGFNSEEMAAAIRLSGRWAVPFFFILSGYLISSNNSSIRALNPLVKAVTIFIVASVMLIPLSVANYGIHETLVKIFSSGFLMSGTYFHLWYLSSVVVGLLILLVIEKQGLERFLPPIAILSILLYLVMGAYNPVSEAGIKVARHFSSVGFLYLGMILGRTKPTAFKGSLILVIGFGIQLIEAKALTYIFEFKSILKYQFLIGTILFSIGAFILARSIRPNTFRVLGLLGAKHSLSIYIFHPYFIYIFKLIPLSPLLSDLLIIPSVFTLSLIFSLVLEKKLKSFYCIVNGDFKFLKKKVY